MIAIGGTFYCHENILVARGRTLYCHENILIARGDLSIATLTIVVTIDETLFCHEKDDLSIATHTIFVAICCRPYCHLLFHWFRLFVTIT